MANRTYNISEIVGTSPDGVDAAVRNAISEASQTLRNLDWFEVQSVRGHVQGLLSVLGVTRRAEAVFKAQQLGLIR